MLALSSQATQTSLCAIKNEEGRDINISIKRTQAFDIFVFIHLLMSGPSSLAKNRPLFRECGIMSFGMRNTAQGIRNPTKDWNTGSKFKRQRLESSTLNSESTAWNPESTTVMETLMWGEHKFWPYPHPYMLMPASLVRPCYVYANTCVPGAEEQARPGSDAVLFLCRT